MEVALVLVGLAALLGAVLVATLIASLVIGGRMARDKDRRALRLLFLIVIPAASAGAIGGGVAAGSLAFGSSVSLLFVAALAGLLLVGLAGLCAGLLGAGFWWWRATKRALNGRGTT